MRGTCPAFAHFVHSREDIEPEYAEAFEVGSVVGRKQQERTKSERLMIRHCQDGWDE